MGKIAKHLPILTTRYNLRKQRYNLKRTKEARTARREEKTKQQDYYEGKKDLLYDTGIAD